MIFDDNRMNPLLCYYNQFQGINHMTIYALYMYVHYIHSTSTLTLSSFKISWI